MILIPAIDILEGRAVRLAKGSFEEQTFYDADPLEPPRCWAAAGAQALPVADRDGARGVAQAVPGTFVYSGGISSVDELRALAELREPTLAGVIVGKALYEGRFTVQEGQAALGG